MTMTWSTDSRRMPVSAPAEGAIVDDLELMSYGQDLTMQGGSLS